MYKSLSNELTVSLKWSLEEEYCETRKCLIFTVILCWRRTGSYCSQTSTKFIAMNASSWEIISQTNSISVHVNIFYWCWTPNIVHPFHPRRIKLVDRVKSGEQLDMILARWAWGGYVNQSPRGGCGAGVIIAPPYGLGRGYQGDWWEIICDSKLK